MNKIILIIQREYLTRVRKKSFLLTTFLVPLFFIGMYLGIIFLTKKSFDESHSIVLVVDEQGNIGNKLTSHQNVTYVNNNKDLATLMSEMQEDKDNTSILKIPADFTNTQKVEYLSANKPNVSVQKDIRTDLENILRDLKYQELGVNADSIKSINSDVSISAKEVSEDGESKDSNTEIAMGIALALSVLVYISLFLYGSQVMRGIIEEKSSRIIEVIISSVKPFQLMMGKIIGIGLVGLTQFVLWIVVSALLAVIASSFFVDKEVIANQLVENNMQNMESGGAIENTAIQSNVASEILNSLQTINLLEIGVCFFIFFIGGYLIYSALFAAVGSAVDSETEASQFTMPITMPLLLTYVLSFGVLINDPHGSVAVWLSFIPFTSPIAMLVRIPFGVPLWQIAVSASLLIAGFIFTTWVAARIYRVGILMYGKKASYKELIKWFKYKS